MTVAIVGTLPEVALFTDAHESLHPLTVDDYRRMVDVGILDEDDKVELLEGAIIAMSPEGRPHAHVYATLTEHLVRGIEDRSLFVRPGNPFEVQPDSMPEPDLAIVDRSDSSWNSTPERAHLIVEVSFSSLKKDLDRKARIYARAGVPEYWVVNLKALVVHVHLEPRRNGYAVVHDVAPPAELQPTYLQLPPIALSELLSSD